MNQRIAEIMRNHGLHKNISEDCQHRIEMIAELIIQECIDCCGSQADRKNIRKCFGLPIESNVMYPGPETIGHHSQYERKYNIPDNG